MRAGNLIYTDWKRAIFSFRFLFSVLGVTAMMLAAVSGILSSASHISIWYLMELSIQGSGTGTMILCTLPVFAFGLSYAAEKETHAERYWIIRAGTGSYALSKVLNSACSGFLTVFLGISFFAVLLFTVLPFYNTSFTDGIYEALMAEGRVLLGFLLYASHHAFSGAITAVCAMWFSTLIPNRFAVAAAPLVIYFTLLRVRNWDFPPLIDPVYWIDSIYNTETAGKTIFIKIVTSVLLCTIMGVFAKYNIDRRLLNE